MGRSVFDGQLGRRDGERRRRGIVDRRVARRYPMGLGLDQDPAQERRRRSKSVLRVCVFVEIRSSGAAGMGYCVSDAQIKARA